MYQYIIYASYKRGGGRVLWIFMWFPDKNKVYKTWSGSKRLVSGEKVTGSTTVFHMFNNFVLTKAFKRDGFFS